MQTNWTLTTLVCSIVRSGITAVADEWCGYNGLSKAGYKHEKVKHNKNQKVSAEGLESHPIEGLFSRVGRFVRQNYVRMSSCKNYGLQLAEYCWRLSWGNPKQTPNPFPYTLNRPTDNGRKQVSGIYWTHKVSSEKRLDGVLLLMIKILHYLKDPRLWELRYMPSYGSCTIYIINRISVGYFRGLVR